ncbi:YIF1-domain-containing protein [Guyanagaster necrorhizus]|uniref:Protein YIF1 n=1 Tax=Guyanagaster necrorhizus TaxID=856835 RepID=A0A9P8AP66_9AGAR|nr:YIF1-domain-containing protein [Guyanagaster necrorhizus MCA 3950]KAG7443013.1 YIF1-domain-containing protein [Guyanagaster necrorhizus MCA 3950]
MNYSSHSPPPLRHPVPTHPAYIPEPPLTPGSPQGYQRFSSSPQPQPQQQYTHVPAYSCHFQPPPPPNPNVGSNFVQPDFVAWGMNDATTQLGLQLGNSAVQAGQEYVQRNFGGFFPLASLKHQFNVSNSYVMRKLKLVIFPWDHRPWSRRIRRSEQGVTEWQPPREDVNSPDLYIPLMALVTYMLIAAFHSGIQDRFHPKVLGELASGAFLVVLVDFGFVYLGCYFLNIQGSSQALDIIAYSGYKFVGVILTIVFGFLNMGRTLYTIVFLYFFFANAFFLVRPSLLRSLIYLNLRVQLRSLRSVVLPDPSITNNANSTATVSAASRRRRIIFLFLEAICQILYMGILVRV